MKLTKQQQIAVKRIYNRAPLSVSFLAFRRSVQPAIGLDCVLVQWAGMWLGIETDGYTHS